MNLRHDHPSDRSRFCPPCSCPCSLRSPPLPSRRLPRQPSPRISRRTASPRSCLPSTGPSVPQPDWTAWGSSADTFRQPVSAHVHGLGRARRGRPSRREGAPGHGRAGPGLEGEAPAGVARHRREGAASLPGRAGSAGYQYDGVTPAPAAVPPAAWSLTPPNDSTPFVAAQVAGALSDNLALLVAPVGTTWQVKWAGELVTGIGPVSLSAGRAPGQTGSPPPAAAWCSAARRCATGWPSKSTGRWTSTSACSPSTCRSRSWARPITPPTRSSGSGRSSTSRCRASPSRCRAG